tara:strand:- start:2126 stop:2800 length:675 start_codon:yes stop_codon:yes gene_type:complete
MNKTSYHDRIVHKPWGYEYTIFKNSNKLAATFVKINYNQKTSLHCHPNKKTSFIILQGNALVQLGIYKSNCKKYTAPSRMVIRPGLFHSIKSISKKGLIALEFEKPAIKKDLLRYKDDYGRANMPYESFKNTSIINNKLLFFKKPKNKIKYKVGNTTIYIDNLKNLKNIKKNENSISAILDGRMINKKKQTVIEYGEVVKTKTLKIFSESFNIDKKLLILRVKK